MLDIETLSTTTNSVILTIGAIKFSRYKTLKSIKKDDLFYRRVDISSCIKLDMDISEKTIDWWYQQNEECRNEAFNKNQRYSIDKVLKEFNEWFGLSKYIWSHGDDFDITILKNAYDKCKLTPPWKYWNTRDTRTLFDITSINLKTFVGTNRHHPLYDCLYQILALQDSFKILKKLKI